MMKKCDNSKVKLFAEQRAASGNNILAETDGMTAVKSSGGAKSEDRQMKQKRKMLVVDDIELNRVILSQMFESEYEVCEASNGLEAIEYVKKEKAELIAILLDVIMPVMDGFGVLDYLVKEKLMEKVPVFLITADSSDDMTLRGYEMGVADVINKPFNASIVRRRVDNVIELYRHRGHLEKLVEDQTHTIKKQVEQLKRMNVSIIDTLSTAIEFRDCESGEHIHRIRFVTKKLLTEINKIKGGYHFTPKMIEDISLASAMHDVGKIAIPDQILNKPGKLTPEEFEIMKTHTTKGCEILKSIDVIQNDKTFPYYYDICRYHHEKWDGKGYPDGLKGDEIPIWAQVVSLADVYDALTSDRVYKAAYSHEKAVEMIQNGECGQFNPTLLNCFLQVADQLPALMQELYKNNTL